MHFSALPGTRREIEAIRDRFAATHADPSIRLINGAESTEEAVRQAIVGHRYVHLATHGFFDPPKLATVRFDRLDAKAGWLRLEQTALNPGLSAGIALAGANRTVQRGQDDGLLTAYEAQQLDLRGTELVVLSACETTLGKPLDGEGLLGLQRAFQVAGASVFGQQPLESR